MNSESTNTLLHSTRDRMTSAESAIIQKRALFSFIETLSSNGIRCHARVSRNGSKMYTQYFARVGSQLIPIGDPSMRKIKPRELSEFKLEYYREDDPTQYEYCIIADKAEDAVGAARAYCHSRSVAQAVLVDDGDNFIWEVEND